MIDISSLDLKELNDLEKEIASRKKELKEKLLTKDELKCDERIVKYLFDNFPGANNDLQWSEEVPVKISYLGGDVYRKLTKGMTLLCDMALKNYQPSQWRAGADKTQIARQSTIIPSKLAADYKAMWNDIWEVYVKYAK